jgi:hypothetical protein
MTTSPNQPAATWQDPNLAASARLDALIAEMSLPEWLAQLGSVWLGFDVVTGDPGRLSPTGPLNVPPPMGCSKFGGRRVSPCCDVRLGDDRCGRRHSQSTSPVGRCRPPVGPTRIWARNPFRCGTGGRPAERSSCGTGFLTCGRSGVI